MTRRTTTQPTDAELAILRVLWQRGPSTVREVHESLGGDARVTYTTTLKLMQIMTEKRLVVRDEAQRSHVYRPAVNRERTQRRLVDDLVERAFGGSARTLILHALRAGDISPKEVEQIRRLLRQEGDRHDDDA